MGPEISSSQILRSYALSPRRLKTPAGLLLAIFLAGVVSIIGTAIHQTRIFEAPIGVALALGAVLWGALVLRKNVKRLASWVFTGLLAVLLTTFAQEAHDVMIPATDLGYAWTYGAIGIAAVVTAFPKLSSDLWTKKL